MMTRKSLADASMQAQKLHAQLHTDYDRPVDIFRVVQELGIWLSSRPLEGGLFGFYLREGDAAGIVLNASHPEYLQRYTCAHELGHHVLGHRSHLDLERDVVGRVDHVNEQAAQAFAGNFLAPIQAVNRVERRLGIARDRPRSAADVYALSRELDVSFSAAVWQLVNLRRLSTGSATDILRTGAAKAKQVMRPGPHPEGDNRAGLVVVGPAGRDVPVLCRPGDELRFRLPENGSTGYVWQLGSPPLSTTLPDELSWDGNEGVSTTPTEVPTTSDAAPGESPVALVADNYLDESGAEVGDAAAPIGVEGQREFVFLAGHPGRQDVVLALRRPWEGDALETVTTRVRVGPRHVLDGLAEAQIRSHVARLAAGGAQ